MHLLGVVNKKCNERREGDKPKPDSNRDVCANCLSYHVITFCALPLFLSLFPTKVYRLNPNRKIEMTCVGCVFIFSIEKNKIGLRKRALHGRREAGRNAK